MMASLDRQQLETAVSLRRSNQEEIEKVQIALLREHLRHASVIPFYKEMWKKSGVDVTDLYATTDLAKLPFTTREDLDNYPHQFGLGNKELVQDIALTSGTTGSPVVVPYTEKDLKRLAFNEALAYYGAGVRPGDRVLLTVTLDRCFIAGLAYYSGVLELGATAIRSGPGQAQRQWEIMRQLAPNVLVGVPTFLLEVAEWGEKNGIDVKASPIETIITIGEPARMADCSLTPVGRHLQEFWGANICSSYGATELETAFGECTAGSGGHVHPELMLVEIIDDDCNILPDGTPGEIVVTPLGVEGFPLVRFRTGDVARLHSEPCDCGWTTKRLGPIEGRLAQRLKVKGTTLYPETIFHALLGQSEVEAAYVEVRTIANGADDLTVVVGSRGKKLDPTKIAAILQAYLRVTPTVVSKPFHEVQAVMFSEGGRKPRKFFDFRDVR